MENKNAVPEGPEPGDLDSDRPAPTADDPEVPEFLKGPDPEEPMVDTPQNATPETAAIRSEGGHTGSPAVAETPEARAPLEAQDPAGQENGMGPEAWDSEFAAATGAENAAASATDEPRATDDSRTQALPAWQQEPSSQTQAMPRSEQDAATGAAVAAEPLAGQDPDTDGETVRADSVAAAKRQEPIPAGPAAETDREARRRQHARDAALTAKPVFARIVQTFLAIAFPFIVVIGSIRAVASSWFLWLDYHRPGFPADGYGFSQADRLTYGNYGVDYINNSAPSAYLGNLVDTNGDPLFLANEVSHMADVKSIIGITYAAGIILTLLAILICLYLWRRYAGGIRRAFFAGSVITLVVMIALTVLAVLNFGTFFTDFHELFFAQGNWTFHANDTLIRLYPEQFWMDAGIVIAGLVLITSLVFLITNWPSRKRRDRARQRQVDREMGLL